MKHTKLFLNIAIFSLFAIAQADWSMYHGNAQRNGYTTVVGPASPKLKWKFYVGGPILASPVIGPDGTIYLGATLDETTPKSFYTIWAVKPDGTLKWKYPVGWLDHDKTPNFTVAVSPSGVVYAGGVRAFYALDSSGNLLWKYDTKNMVMQTPVIAPDGTVYVTLDGKLTAFTPGGVVKWQQEISDPRQAGGPSLSPDGNTIYANGALGSQSKLYAFNTDGTLKWSVVLNQYFWPLAPPAVGNDGTIYIVDNYPRAFNPDGTLKWVNSSLYGGNGYASMTVDPNGNAYYARQTLVWKFNSSGTVVWQKQITQDSFSFGDAMNAILMDGAGNLFMGLGTGKRSAIQVEKRLWVLKSTNGAEVGKYTLPEIAYVSSPALANDGTLYIGCLDGNLYAFGP